MWLGLVWALGVNALCGRAQHSVQEVKVTPGTQVGFVLLSPERTGLRFTNEVAEGRHLTNQILLNGSGVAAGDVDGDGWCDIYLCSLDGPNALFRNRGDFTFENITARAGVACEGVDATGAAFADLDGDGDLDLVVNSLGGGTLCFFNDSQGHFASLDRNPRLNGTLGGTSLALGDVDGDGDLDLYVANYRTVTIRDQPNTRFSFRVIDGRPQVTSINGRAITAPDLTNRFQFQIALGEGVGNLSYDENGEPDALFLNDGTGRFTALSFTNGAFLDETGRPLARPPFDWGLSVMFRDLNGDLAPDIYVCNDFRSPDRIWINDGRAHFRALPNRAIRQTCLSAMGVDVADLNRDGWDDILEMDMLSREHRYRLSQRIDIRPEVQPIGGVDHRAQFSRNMLFLNRGDGTFAEIAYLSGLEATEWSWMPMFLDVDLDGYEDILVPNGFERDNMNVDALRELQRLKKAQQLTASEQLALRKRFPRLATPNLAFRNLGNLRFEETSEAWGFHTAAISQGAAFADFDNDGDLDLVVNNFNGNAGLYQNVTSAPRVAVRLKGRPPNTHGIGARIRLLGGPVTQSQEIIAGGRYLSSDDAMRVFACGAATNGMALEVTWRSGRNSRVDDVRPNRIYTVDEAGAAPPLFALPPVPPLPALFRDVSGLLAHQHHEEGFDDFALQPMLPYRLSQLGPGLAWCDVDGDGWDDLVVGCGRGGILAVLRNDGRGSFERPAAAPWAAAAPRDLTGLVACRRAPGPMVLLAGSSSYEDGATNTSVVCELDWARQTLTEPFPGSPASTGPLALADVDGDGDLDLFVGGRVLRGRYPQAAASLLFRAGTNGTWTLDAENSQALAAVGMVSAAVFTDVDDDGAPDLVLACPWDSLRVFRNNHGRLVDATRAWGLDACPGWWNGVTAGDFDGDGRMDLAASNWGQNSPYERFRGGGLDVFFGDTDGNGTQEAIEAYTDPVRKELMPLQPFHLVMNAMPLIGARVGQCESYARATLAEVYGDTLRTLERRRVHWLESTVFLNRGTRFEARVLPVEAQFAPAFGVAAGDLDGDGREDLFLAQNLFAVPPDASRYDAGRGLCLRGDGAGGFTAMPGQASGVEAYGEQRGAALGDFDGDGRLDLAVGQNGAETKLYRNVGARPGLRVRLAGPAGNVDAIGARIRLGTPAAWGPAHELHAGAGYWSQDSAVAVLARPASGAEIEVRWPGGKVTRSEIPGDAREIRVDLAGRVTTLR